MNRGLKHSDKGQSLVFCLVLIPLLILIFEICFRSGRTALINQQVQRMVDTRALDILATQGEALERLGKINPYARIVIESRRTIDALLATSILTPFFIPSYLRARSVLSRTQKEISKIQKGIQLSATLQVERKLREPVPQKFSRKVTISGPIVAPKLRINEEAGFSGETGAPLELSRDFNQRQNIELSARIENQKFLNAWFVNARQKMPDTTIQSFAKIEMETIEKPWTARLRPAPSTIGSVIWSAK